MRIFHGGATDLFVAKYRKQNGSEIWHWCRNCSLWPVEDFEEGRMPGLGQLCKECISMDAKGVCGER